MTRRRALGLLVIGLVLVLVAVVAHLRPHPIAGVAQAPPVEGPPAVGDCVLDPLPDEEAQSALTADSVRTVPVYPSQRIEPCSGKRFGEVVAIVVEPAAIGMDDQGRAEDLNLTGCLDSVHRYLGIPTPPVPATWSPLVVSYAAMSGPGSRQRAAGQQWAACIAAPPASGPDDAPPARGYDSSLHDALHNGNERNRLTLCMASADPHAVHWPGNCRNAHAAEMLAVGQSGPRPTDRAPFELSCRQLVRQLTGMPDPTASGMLSIFVLVSADQGRVTTPVIPANSFLSCGVATAGTRLLGGSVLALGRQPIPWA